RPGARTALGRPHARPRPGFLRRAHADHHPPDPAPPAGARARLRARTVAAGRPGCHAPWSRPRRRVARRSPAGWRVARRVRAAHARPGGGTVKRTPPALVLLLVALGAAVGLLLQQALAMAGRPGITPPLSLSFVLVVLGVIVVLLALPVRRAVKGDRKRVDPF